MAPKKKQQTQTLSLGAFLNEDKFGGSWADEVEESYGSQPLPAPARTGYSSYGGGGAFGDRGGAYAPRDSFPTELPTRPPYTAHLGNLSYEATQEAVTDFFADCAITSVRIIEDRIENRPKGFAYAEFADLDGLKRALDLDGEQFQGRNIRVRIADPPKGGEFRDGPSARDLGSWERKGPLADAPGRSNDRRNDFGERRGPPRDGPSDEGRSRDFGNWERRGPLSPSMTPETGDDSRDNSRPRGGDRGEAFRNNRGAAWGEPRPEGSAQQPAREFRERTERPERPERAPTAAEMDSQWRSNMKPDQGSSDSRDGSQGPKSPAGPDAAAPAARPRLNLQKRTVTEAAADASGSAGSDAKASPFGAARPIDTAAKEREIEEKRVQALKEQKEAEEKAKEDRRLAKEAAAKEAEEKAAAEAAEAKEAEAKAAAAPVPEAAPAAKAEDTADGESQKIPVRPKEEAEVVKSKAAGSGNWRSSGAEPRPARGGGYVPRGRGDGTRGRGGPGRGGAPRNFEGRPPRSNGSPTAGAQEVPPSPAAAPESEAAPTQDADGWTTVSKPRRK